ncbi:MAG: GMC family oxidoreductase [Dehalococcoidia bacterium]
MGKTKKLDADVVVIGAGPGGCTIAKEMSQRGKKVILLERGGWVTSFAGTMIVPARGMEKMGRTKTDNGDPLYIGMGVGGSTIVYVGAANEPVHEMWRKYGINLTAEAKEARQECRVNRVPDSLITPGNKRIMTAAQELGYPWHNLERFVDMSKCEYGCNKCLMGCPKGARWSAIDYAKQAVKNGTILMTHTKAAEVIVEGGVAGGVRARRRGQDYEIRSKVVVCSAGGIGSARILQRAGIKEAGSWFMGDPAMGVSGYVKEGPGMKDDFPMCSGFQDKENGITIENTYMTRSMSFASAMMGKGKLHALSNVTFRYGRGLGIFAKIRDDDTGRVSIEEGRLHKPLTEADERKLDYGRAICERILIKAGCDPYNINYVRTTLTHPAGTVKVGVLLDYNLQTSIKNLYCCDASVMPEGLGMPPVLTIVSLGKRLAKHLEKAV